MKQFIGLTIFLIISISGFNQNKSSKIFRIKLKYIDSSIIEITPGTIQKLENLGFKFDPNYAYLSRNFSEIFDFNKDGFKDLIMVFGKDPSIGSPLTVLLWDNIKNKYVENSEYLILGHGDHMFYYDTVDDFDGDGDIDVYFPMENYHGENGKQPSYYLKNDFYMPGNYLRNTGSKFQRIYIDTITNDYGDKRGYPNYSSASSIYYDEDTIKDIIVPSINQHPLNKGYLATRYSFTSSGDITRSFVFPWTNNQMYKGQTHSMIFKNYKDKIYAFVQPKEDYPDGINTFYYYTYPEVWIYNKSKNNQQPVLIKSFELKRNISLFDAAQILNHDTFYLTDLDNDGNEEIIIGKFRLPLSSKHFSIHIFNNTGNEVTDKWFYNQEYIDSTGAAANGFDVIDLNNDGYDDILFRDRFNSTDNDISVLMNTGNSFEQHIIKTNSIAGFNIAVDTDKNGIHEIIRVGNKIKEINNSVVKFKIDINNCSKISKPIFSNTNYSFCSGDSLKLSITNINKGDSLIWYFGTKSDLTNVANKTFIDSSKVFVIKTDSVGCIISSDTIELKKLSLPAPPSLVKDSANNLVASTNGISWYKDGIRIIDTTQKIKPTSSGLYTATTTQNGCTSLLGQGYYYLTNAVANLTNGEFFKVSPNPTSGELNINYRFSSIKNVCISVIDMNGRNLILNRKITSGSKINLGSLSKGSYIIQVKDNSGRLITSQKLVKN